MTTEMTLIKAERTYEDGTRVEVGCKAARHVQSLKNRTSQTT